jgi:hypothetical protein
MGGYWDVWGNLGKNRFRCTPFLRVARTVPVFSLIDLFVDKLFCLSICTPVCLAVCISVFCVHDFSNYVSWTFVVPMVACV